MDTSLPPLPPTIIDPTSENKGQLYLYSFMTIDLDDNDVYYFIDGGYTTNSG
jgi:hypothetical protein